MTPGFPILAGGGSPMSLGYLCIILAYIDLECDARLCIKLLLSNGR
jgi:hypothetical protein